MTGIVINLPYASAAVPPPVARRLALSQAEWQLEHWRLIDPHLAELARAASVHERRGLKVERPVVAYPLSPLVADPWGLWAGELDGRPPEAAPPEAPEDSRPRPAALPRTTAGRSLAWTDQERDLIFSRSVVPYYRELTEAARGLLADSPLVLVVTLRSYGTQPLPFEKNRRYPRPQAAVAANPRLTPAGLAELAGGILKACRWWPELNWPQAGGACLPPELEASPRVRALGLSLCRGLYLDERSGKRKSAAPGVVRILRTFFHLLDQELARVARLRLARAAPPAKPAPKIPSPVIKADRLNDMTALPEPEAD